MLPEMLRVALSIGAGRIIASAKSPFRNKGRRGRISWGNSRSFRKLLLANGITRRAGRPLRPDAPLKETMHRALGTLRAQRVASLKQTALQL